MLNLNNPITYTAEELTTIDSITRAGGTGSDMWDNAKAKPIKHRISVHTIVEQQCRCAYCETLLMQGSTQIEHFAHKGNHPRFTFEPQNLVSACVRCNSSAIKGQKETMVLPKKPVYNQNSFLYVHPRLDNPDNEIVFTDETRTVFDTNRCTQKGKATIDFFHWNDMDAIASRFMNKDRSTIPIDVQQYAMVISTYKP